MKYVLSTIKIKTRKEENKWKFLALLFGDMSTLKAKRISVLTTSYQEEGI